MRGWITWFYGGANYWVDQASSSACCFRPSIIIYRGSLIQVHWTSSIVSGHCIGWKIKSISRWVLHILISSNCRRGCDRVSIRARNNYLSCWTHPILVIRIPWLDLKVDGFCICWSHQGHWGCRASQLYGSCPWCPCSIVVYNYIIDEDTIGEWRSGVIHSVNTCCRICNIFVHKSNKCQAVDKSQWICKTSNLYLIWSKICVGIPCSCHFYIKGICLVQSSVGRLWDKIWTRCCWFIEAYNSNHTIAELWILPRRNRANSYMRMSVSRQYKTNCSITESHILRVGWSCNLCNSIGTATRYWNWEWWT